MDTVSSYFKQASQGHLSITGEWVLANFGELKQLKSELRQALDDAETIDFSELQQLDTNGAYLLVKYLGADRIESALDDASLAPAFRALLAVVQQSITEAGEHQPELKQHSAIALWLDRMGRRTLDAKNEAVRWFAFFGMVLEGMCLNFLQPHKWRLTSVIAHIDASGYQAVPIIFLLNYLIGAVVAFLGATVLEQFGATIFTVHLVGFAFMREFGVLLTAILMAGRTASAFTAHIGSMRLHEEIDALKVSGVNPIHVLVLPRVTALLVSLPLLTFIAIGAGILGGMTVSIFMLGISPTLFVEILVDKVGLRHFLVGMSKAPIFALVIATTGCLEGFKVRGSAESLGRQTTNSVVKCIFLVILIDALMAMFFMEMGW
ncbi:MlaE family lipid ABC transporter permease subunit [Oligella urethralis]|uniref:MlaE family lipid ABC transporter permease subunit n=1 Tax=Oligella urethralis TaxID=90245 RepID=UPI00254E99F4|nr:MlaE family lipid ABC transporter permease subunit [Oligella urethralis]MDK6202788.1 MlaE family lipid ABC transporter permease subunit [Oligella urethralis]